MTFLCLQSIVVIVTTMLDTTMNMLCHAYVYIFIYIYIYLCVNDLCYRFSLETCSKQAQNSILGLYLSSCQHDCFYHHLQSNFSAKSYILYCAGPKLTVPRSSGLDSISLGTVEASLRARQESKFRALIHTKTCGIPRLGHRFTVEQGCFQKVQGSAEGTENIRSQKQESTFQECGPQKKPILCHNLSAVESAWCDWSVCFYFVICKHLQCGTCYMCTYNMYIDKI